MWIEKRFNFGERRSVSLDVSVDEGQPLPPNTPTWELTDYKTGIVEANGDCSVTQVENQYVLSALIEPQHTGLYRLTFSFGIGSEVRKPCMIFKVK